ncbi:MAG: ATP-binding protein [Candidatus Woesearchaeota archaeon]
MKEIVVGRSPSDLKKLGLKGCVKIGKMYIRMGENLSLSNPVYVDLSTSHVILIVGKRGSGKSYTMGVVAEGFALLEPEIRKNIAIVMIDTMGVYWTMKYPNKQQEDELESFGLKPQAVDCITYVPYAYFDRYKNEGIPVDQRLILPASEISPEEWASAFRISPFSREGVIISKTVLTLREKIQEYTLDDMISFVMKDEEADSITKMSVVNLFKMAKGWGLFGKPSTKIVELFNAGKVSVIDISPYATMPGGWPIKALVTGLIAQHAFKERMKFRKDEEFQELSSVNSFFTFEKKEKKNIPLIWLVIDEAHEFLPVDEKDANAATEPLKIILREGRQPGVSLILATQQPGKIHTDAITQADIVIAHRVTSKIDIDALQLLAQSWMKESITASMNQLPSAKGSAVLFDDTNERLFSIRIRPRISWHGGGSPSAIPSISSQQ